CQRYRAAAEVPEVSRGGGSARGIARRRKCQRDRAAAGVRWRRPVRAEVPEVSPEIGEYDAEGLYGGDGRARGGLWRWSRAWRSMDVELRSARPGCDLRLRNAAQVRDGSARGIARWDGSAGTEVPEVSRGGGSAVAEASACGSARGIARDRR